MKAEHWDKLQKRIARMDEADLQELMTLVQSRRSVLHNMKKHQALASIRVGDTVEFTSVRPLYLVGTRGKIVGRKGSKFRVELALPVDPRALRRFGHTPLAHATSLKKVEDI